MIVVKGASGLWLVKNRLGQRCFGKFETKEAAEQAVKKKKKELRASSISNARISEIRVRFPSA